MPFAGGGGGSGGGAVRGGGGDGDGNAVNRKRKLTARKVDPQTQAQQQERHNPSKRIAKGHSSNRSTKAGQSPKTAPSPTAGRRPAPVELVFDGGGGDGCAAVVTKQDAKVRRQQRRRSQREAEAAAEAEQLVTAEQSAVGAKAEREKEVTERNAMWRSIRALSASTMTGWRLREWQERQRRELGAKASKTQQMPLKMRVGIMKKRNAVATKETERVRESGLVTQKHKGNKKQRARTAAGADATRRQRRGGHGGGDVGDAGVRDGVMNVSFLFKNSKKK
jgi:hypothetical protein